MPTMNSKDSSKNKKHQKRPTYNYIERISNSKALRFAIGQDYTVSPSQQ